MKNQRIKNIYKENSYRLNLKRGLWIKAHLSYLAILSSLCIIIWPVNNFFSFDRPKSFSILINAQMITLSYFVMRIGEKGGIYQISQEINSLRKLKSNFIGTFLFSLVIFFSSFPIILPFYFIGGIYLKYVLEGYLLLFVSIITFINLSLCCSLLIKSSDFRPAITHILFFLFLGGLFLTRTKKEELFYLNPLFFLSILGFSFLFLFIILQRLKNLDSSKRH